MVRELALWSGTMWSVFATPVLLSDPLPPSFTVTGASIWSGMDTTLWSTANTTLTLNNGQCAEFVITGYFTAFGEFTNTVTLDTDTATAGAELSASATVSVVSACAAEHIIPDGALASVVGSVYSGTTVTIMGQFIVDEDVLFQNCQVYMEAGAEIVVQPGRTLDIMSSSVTSCQQVMWKGIIAQDGSLVRMRGSFVDDAENAVTALDGSTLWLRSNQFHNNRVCIQVPAAMGIPYNNVGMYMRQNTFYSQGPMPQPYPGQTTALGEVGFAALDVHNTTLHLTDGENVIHTLSNGIVARRSNLEVIGWSMHGIQPDGAYAYTGNGAGIYAHGNNASCTLKQEGYGQGGSDPPSFVDCLWGIYAEYMNVKSASNRMLDMGTAHRVDFGGFRRVQILDNAMQAQRHGIDLRFNDGAQQVLVQGNDITFGALACTGNCPGYSGINVAEGNYPSESSVIRNNVIRFVADSPSRIGINLLAADRWLVAGNTLLIAHNTHNRTGVLLSGCNRTEVSCNTIGSAFNDWSNDRQAAISNFMGSAPLISCNDMDRTTNGILFNGVAPDADVRGNRIRRHKWGLHLTHTAIIGLQELKGNLWHNAAPLEGWGAWNQHPEALNDPFLYYPATIGGGSTQPPSVSPDGWFQPTLSGSNYDCGDDGGVDYCSQFVKRGKEKLTELDVRVANDSMENEPYTDETKWMLKSGLYRKLDDDPDLQDSLEVLAELYAELQSSATAVLKIMDDGQRILYEMDSTVVAQWQVNDAQIDSLMALVRNGLEELGDTMLTSAQRQAILSSISGYRQEIRDLSESNSAAMQATSADKVLNADNVQTANTAVITNEPIEANQKQVNNIYLATIGKDADVFTTDQSANLFAIANQCPMIGGNAVFKARSLYGLIHDGYTFDDSLLCAPYGIEVKRLAEQHANAVKVVPNPANDEARLLFTVETREPGYLMLFNALGSEALRVLVPKGVMRHAFSTAGIAPGLYHYRISSGDGLVGEGKLTIVR